MPFMQLQFTDEEQNLYQREVRSPEELKTCLSFEKNILYLWIQRSYGFTELPSLPDTLLGLLIEDCSDLVDSSAQLPKGLTKVGFNNCPVLISFAGDLPITITWLGLRMCPAICRKYSNFARSASGDLATELRNKRHAI